MDPPSNGFAAPRARRKFSVNSIYRQFPVAPSAKSPDRPFPQSATALPNNIMAANDPISPALAIPRSKLSVDPDALSDIDSDGAHGEPIVHDFADKYIPKEFRPPKHHHGDSQIMHISALQLSSDDEAPAAPPPDLSRRGIHIPSRTSSAALQQRQRRSGSPPTTPESREKMSYAEKSSTAESIMSYDTTTSSLPGDLPKLQTKPIDEVDRLTPLAEDDPASFDLVAHVESDARIYSLERRSELLFSREHLAEIFAEPAHMLKFTSFLSKSRPNAIPLLIYYLDSLKALAAINYANAVAEALEPIPGLDFTEHLARPTVNSILEEKSRAAFEALVREELPAYITHVFIQYVSVSIQRRITGTLPPHLRDASEGLAEVFCLTDPSRPDNPIVFASEEFHRTTQYGVGYAIGRNCRFLQGPRTNPFSSRRIRTAVQEEREISEVFLNYRRDGSPFMNLLMIAPLFDSRGKLRYFIGAQVDVSGLVKDCTDLEALQKLLAKQDMRANGEEPEETGRKDEFQELSEMLNTTELEIVRKFGGKMHREQVEEMDEAFAVHRPRLLLKEPSPDLSKVAFSLAKEGGKLEGIYQNYLLIRPYPSLRILFASPKLRVPGMAQSPFLSRIGGSARVRDELTAALAAGRGVTAKVRWISSPLGSRYGEAASQTTPPPAADEGRARWIHCTPLLGHNGAVGVWMVVIVDEEGSEPRRRWRKAPPVASDLSIQSTPQEHHQHRPGRKSSFHEELETDSMAGSPYEGTHGRKISAGMNSSPARRSNAASSSRAQAQAHVHAQAYALAQANGSEFNKGAFAEWERKRANGSVDDGDGSMRSFGLI